MVALTFNYNILIFRNINIFYQWLSIGSFHLLVILMNREKDLETIIVLALAFLIVSLWLDISWLMYLSIGLLTLSFISKRLTALIGKGWLSFSNYLGVVMNYIIMFIIFYFILFPLSFFQRRFNHNQILKKVKGDSHFHQRNHLFSIKDIENPW